MPTREENSVSTTERLQHIEQRPFFVHDEEFAHSYVQGYNRFQTHFALHSPLSDDQIYSFLEENIDDELNSPRSNAGYITGWMAGLLRRPVVHPAHHMARIQAPSSLQEA